MGIYYVWVIGDICYITDRIRCYSIDIMRGELKVLDNVYLNTPFRSVS